MTMLSARGVKVETIDELLTAGFAIKKSELVGRGRPTEITQIAITDAGRRALKRGMAFRPRADDDLERNPRDADPGLR